MVDARKLILQGSSDGLPQGQIKSPFYQLRVRCDENPRDMGHLCAIWEGCQVQPWQREENPGREVMGQLRSQQSKGEGEPAVPRWSGDAAREVEHAPPPENGRHV